MSSQLVDINADGFNDILCGSFSGTPQIVMGGKEGFAKPNDVVDLAGEQVLIAKFWNREESKWDETDRCGTIGLCTSSAAVDWDDDGDLDLILGAYRSGKLYLRINEGTASDPKFAAENVEILAGESAMKVPQGLAAPKIVDWNDDGKFDILCGGSKGGVFYFANRGTKRNPKFGPYEELITPVDKKGSFIGIVPNQGELPAMPGSSWHVETVDYDGDGDLDLLIGGRSSWTASDAVELTADEQDKLDHLSEQMNELRVEMSDFVKDMDDAERAKAVKSNDEFRELSSRFSKVFREQRKLAAKSDPQKSGDFVWVFRRK